MNRAFVLVLGMFLLVVPFAAFAQKPGGHGKQEAPAPELKDFNLALALQATPAQAAQFQALAKSTSDAQSHVEALLQAQAGDYGSQTNALKEAVEQISSGKTQFIGNLTDAQKSGLKDRLKRLSKADSEVSKAWKTLDQQLSGSKPDKAGVSGAAQRLKQALDSYQAEQKRLAADMGIGSGASSS